MKFWEAMKALQEGKKVTFDGFTKGNYLSPEYGELLMISPKDRANDTWEIYEEPNPEIKLTPEMVGRKVRLTNGDIVLITLYSIDSLQWYGGGVSWSENGKRWKDETSADDIVEILPKD